MTRRSRFIALTVLLDVLLVNAAFALGYYVRYRLQWFAPVEEAFFAPYRDYWQFQFWHTVLMLVFLYVDGAYAYRRDSNWFTELYRVGNATTTMVAILIAVTFFFRPLVYSRLLFVEVAVLTITLLGGARLVRRIVEGQFRKRGLGMERVLIVGAGELGRAVMRTFVARPELGYHVVGFVDDNPAKGDLGRFKALGGLDHIETLLKDERVDELIITLPWMYHRTIVRLVRAGEALGVRVRVVPDYFQLSLSRVDFTDLDGIPLMGIKEIAIPRLGRVAKRALDLTLAVIALLAAAVPMAMIALLIRLESPGPALFRQVRVGEHGKLFHIYKFRSMRVGAEAEKPQLKARNEATGPLFKIKDDPRMTGMGRFLRRSSLDELPNLFNVLRGEMSLVGPRPALPEEVAQFEPWQKQRLEAPPGLTCLWQVSGRSDLSFDEGCLLDIYYIENWSLGLDVTILLRTLPRVLMREGAY
jgi:exopolysaccharide biosynthesis polyprenyl glycosylphosphotransferase